jgi:hypothetical protein
MPDLEPFYRETYLAQRSRHELRLAEDRAICLYKHVVIPLASALQLMKENHHDPDDANDRTLE